MKDEATFPTLGIARAMLRIANTTPTRLSVPATLTGCQNFKYVYIFWGMFIDEQLRYAAAKCYGTPQKMCTKIRLERDLARSMYQNA
jgi:hypothetical protein